MCKDTIVNYIKKNVKMSIVHTQKTCHLQENEYLMTQD